MSYVDRGVQASSVDVVVVALRSSLERARGQGCRCELTSKKWV